ncbi:MAG: hypothetical protein ACPL5F_04155 [Moorellaceae bacterium]
MGLSDLELTVNLYTEGEKFFDLLKAAIRDWQHSPWGHERERAGYALELYRRGLDILRAHLEEARAKAEVGYFTGEDNRLLSQAEGRMLYWEKKLAELTGKPDKDGL